MDTQTIVIIVIAAIALFVLPKLTGRGGSMPGSGRNPFNPGGSGRSPLDPGGDDRSPKTPDKRPSQGSAAPSRGSKNSGGDMVDRVKDGSDKPSEKL